MFAPQPGIPDWTKQALTAEEAEEAVEEAIVAKPLITNDPRPRCGDEYTINRKFGGPLVVTCNKYAGHAAPDKNRISRRHWNVDHRTGWFTQKEVAGEA